MARKQPVAEKIKALQVGESCEIKHGSVYHFNKVIAPSLLPNKYRVTRVGGDELTRIVERVE